VNYQVAHCLTFEGGTVDCGTPQTYSGPGTSQFIEPILDAKNCPVAVPIPIYTGPGSVG
jgi:hypothetical protein